MEHMVVGVVTPPTPPVAVQAKQQSQNVCRNPALKCYYYSLSCELESIEEIVVKGKGHLRFSRVFRQCRLF